MHFWVSAARVGKPEIAPGHLSTSGARCPRKIGTNWFMPALVKSRLGASGRRLDEGTIVCCFDLKKSRNDWRISLLVILLDQSNHKSPRDDTFSPAHPAISTTTWLTAAWFPQDEVSAARTWRARGRTCPADA